VERFTGELLRLKKVQRQQMGAYLCIASNNVPPAVSKRIILNVNCECAEHRNLGTRANMFALVQQTFFAKKTL
jgi:hypothetical protein